MGKYILQVNVGVIIYPGSNFTFGLTDLLL